MRASSVPATTPLAIFRAAEAKVKVPSVIPSI